MRWWEGIRWYATLLLSHSIQKMTSGIEFWGWREGEGDGRHRGRSGEVWGVEDMRGMGKDDAQKAEK